MADASAQMARPAPWASRVVPFAGRPGHIPMAVLLDPRPCRTRQPMAVPALRSPLWLSPLWPGRDRTLGYLLTAQMVTRQSMTRRCDPRPCTAMSH